MPLIGDRDLIRIDLPAEGEWVEVKRKLSRGDEIAVQQAVASTATLKMSGGSTTADDADFGMDAGAAIEAAEFALLDIAIKAWCFPDPPTKANIRKLDPESVEALKGRLDEMYEKPLSEDESRNLERNGATPSSEREESLAG